MHHQPSKKDVTAVALAGLEQSAGLAAAVWALLIGQRADQTQLDSLDGLEVRESTWDEWEALCANSIELTRRR